MRLIIFFLFANFLYGANVETISVFSMSMNKKIKNLVITPDQYADVSLSTVYLLHGAGGSYLDWSTKVQGLEQYCDKLNIILICPDGGDNSWYFDSPIDSNYRYETYICEELVDFIDNKYLTKKDPKFRAISGLSMGGHGALYLSIKNQNIFGLAGSMSGGLDIRGFSNNWNLSDRLGNIKENPKNWENNTVIKLIDRFKIKDLKLIIDCGKDDFFLDVNNAFNSELTERNINHIYRIKEGSHNWIYWRKSIFEHLNFFTENFNKTI